MTDPDDRGRRPPGPLLTGPEILDLLDLDPDQDRAGTVDLQNSDALRRPRFRWRHFGRADTPIRRLLKVFGQRQFVSAPRTGHLGNWQEIAAGRAGAMDGNALICRNARFGYPLVFDLNQSEDLEITRGDTVHVPGSVIDAGRREILDLFSWTGSRFALLDRKESYYVPFLATRDERSLLPVTSLHRKLDNELTDFNFIYYSSLLTDHWSAVRATLTHLLNRAIESSEPESLLKLIVNRAVSLDGRVHQRRLQLDDGILRIGDARYADVDRFVEAIRIPILAASRPDRFFSEIGSWSAAHPLLSAPVHSLLMGVLKTQYPDFGLEASPAGAIDEPNVHLHWGAVQMAGFPPRKKGHFVSGSRYVRRLFDLLAGRSPVPDPLYFILLPSSIFMLCPSSAYPKDRTLLSNLFERTYRLTRSGGRRRTVTQPEVDGLVEAWWAAGHSGLSQYFIGSFARRRSIYTGGPVPVGGRPLLCETLKRLTVAQASMLVGALYEVIGGGVR